MRDGHVIAYVAGLHALGTVDAAHYVTEHPPELWSPYSDEPFSMAVTAEFKGLSPTSIAVLLPPQR